MRPVVDRDLCTGCGLCEEECPDMFRLDEDGIARVIRDEPGHELWGQLEECVDLCPVDAISVSGS